MLAQTLHKPIGAAIDVMVPEKTQEATDCLPKAQSKLGITQSDGPDILTAQENLETQSPEKQVCGRAHTEDVSATIPEISQPCVNLAEAASTELTSNVEETVIIEENDHVIMDHEFTFPFPDPASTLEIQGSARSDQGAQGTCSPSSSPVDHSEVFNVGGVHPPNISDGRSIVNVLADTYLPNNPMGQNLQMHFPLISDPYDYELEKLRREEGDLRKNFEETTLELMAELERKMAEARSEYDRKSKEIDVAYNAKAMEEEANRNLVAMSSVLANAFMSKGTDNSVASDLAAAIRAARSSQHSIQQQQAVETNTHMNPTAPPRPSADAPIPNQSRPQPRCNTTQPILISQQAVAELNTLVNSTAPRPNSSGSLSHFPRSQPMPLSQKAIADLNTLLNSTATPQPSVTAADTLIPNLSGSLSHSSTQPRPISQQAVAELNALVNSTASPRPSGRTEALPLHLPRCNMPQTRPPPLIPNINPLSSPPVHGTVRRPAPHIQRFRPSPAPNTAAAASTTYPRRLVQEQQQGKTNGDLVCLSDDDD